MAEEKPAASSFDNILNMGLEDSKIPEETDEGSAGTDDQVTLTKKEYEDTHPQTGCNNLGWS